MTEKEIKELLEKKEVLDYLKKNLKLELNVEPCENINGYDITAEVKLFGETLAEDTDCI